MNLQSRSLIAVGVALGLLMAMGLHCMTVPSKFDVTVNLGDEDRARIDTLNGNLKHLTDATDKTLKLFGVTSDNTPAEDD